MGKIIQLDDNLSNLIAAGEVVENMASVVKELVENSIDANSANIRIELQEYGLNEIKIVDDGDGMSLEDMKMAVKRHATSKIKTANDLFHINSLGFRGEALPSIASVSHLEIISSEGELGHRIFYLKGELKESGEYAPRKGTSIAVRYLFYNTPARLKHLKATNTELSYIVDYINKIALSHPEISFTLSNNNKQLFKSNGSSEYLKVLSNIYNIDIIKNMVKFENKNQYFEINGYLTKPIFSRSSRTHITVIANNRMIKNNKVINAVTEGFRTYLPIGKYPIVFLNITLDPLLIDVNVHPQKLEVKFTEERMLLSLIKTTINDTLKTLSLIPEIKEEAPKQVFVNESLDLRQEDKTEKTYKYEDLKFKSKDKQPSLVKEDFVNYINNLVEKKKEKDIHNELVIEEKLVEEKLEVKEIKRPSLPRLEYIGQYLGTYLIAQNEEGLYLVDQHAAAERVRYENYYNRMSTVEVISTELLIPITLNLSNQEVLALEDNLEVFKPLGLELIVNDYMGVDILKVPTWFPETFERIYTEEIVRYVLEGKDVTIGEIRDSLAKSLSCKHSIKANKFINKNEIEKLLADLEKTVNPYTCPHGRPVIIKFTQTEIEKLFKRIM
ncbi:DNA mismatch repair protein MutL [Candidatus Izimaplasma bacterium HR1]|jgi:DNA mismatch repair protein MutL|uniref:DNA mismatch repair endonuclease MutL n=1 Tax=Candidatus Izimoplasma sp. HR1 TaxID=1541959 RepID=UPI0004F72BE1|nr:DNA mismatch repair protein MutL [Candidatus Izimaplasma bacterium HR1]